MSGSNSRNAKPSSTVKRPTLLRGQSSALNTKQTMLQGESTQTRLRSRSLVNGTVSASRDGPAKSDASMMPFTSKRSMQQPAASTSLLSHMPDSPSIRISQHDQDSSSTTDESEPPQTPLDTEPDLPRSGVLGLRPRRSSLELYKPLDIKGKGRALDQEEVMQGAYGESSWISIPVAPTPKYERPGFAFTVQQDSPSTDWKQSKAPRLGHRRQTLDSLESPLRSATTPLSANDLNNTPQSPAGLYSLAGPIVTLMIIFAGSTFVVIFAISTLNLSIPKSLSQVLEEASALKAYSKTSNMASVHILSVLGIMFIWKQAFSIPGSLLTNVLFGSLYGVFYATLISSFATAVGSLACYFMAMKTGPLVRYLMPKPLATLERNIELKAKNKGDLFSYLLLMRLFPLLPYAVLNIAGGVLNIPTSTFFWTLLLGSIPFNAVTTQVGDILSSLPADAATNLSSIWTPALLLKLVTISAVSALPILFKSRIQNLLGGHAEESQADEVGLLSDMDRKNESIELNSARSWQTERRTASVEDRTSYDGSEERSSVEDDSETIFEVGEGLLVAGISTAAVLV